MQVFTPQTPAEHLTHQPIASDNETTARIMPGKRLASAGMSRPGRGIAENLSGPGLGGVDASRASVGG